MKSEVEGEKLESKPEDRPMTAPPLGSGLLTKQTLIVVASGSAVIVLLLTIWHLGQILLLVFASILLALFLRTLANFIHSHTPLPVSWSLALVVVLWIGVFMVILVLYGPDLADGFYHLFKQAPSAPERLRNELQSYEWGPAVIDTLSKAGQTLTSPRQLIGIAGIFSTAFGAIGSVLFVIVLSLYLAADPKTYINGIARLFPREQRGRVHEAFNRMGHALRWWLLGRITAMVIVGIMIGIGLAVMGMPFAFILGLVAALMDFIPNIGPLIALIPAIMVGLAQDGTTVLYIIIFYLVVQGLEGYLISPYIEEQVVSLPPALLLAAQLLMGAGLGILGVLLASPLTVVAMVLVQMLYMRDVLGQEVDLP